MTSLYQTPVTIAGAGVLGLTVGVRLALAGASVTVVDPARLADNASGVAAGMLAPVFELLAEAPSAGGLPLLVSGRDGWPALLDAVAAPHLLDRSGALLVVEADEEAALVNAAARLQTLGATIETLGAGDLRRLQSGLSPHLVGGLFAADDWRLDPPSVLAALKDALIRLGGRVVHGRMDASAEGIECDGTRVEGLVVVASGAEADRFAGLAPALSSLSPVKGQILHFDAPPRHGVVVRGLSGYVAPQAGGAIVGATMELGRRDRELQADTLAGLRARAARVFPHLADASARGMAGVRAATPDGLPLVGRVTGVGEVFACVGARRNGWLLAPLLADVLLRAMTGAAPGPYDALFEPDRFSRAT